MGGDFASESLGVLPDVICQDERNRTEGETDVGVALWDFQSYTRAID